jgi:hypothetical protein
MLCKALNIIMKNYNDSSLSPSLAYTYSLAMADVCAQEK